MVVQEGGWIFILALMLGCCHAATFKAFGGGDLQSSWSVTNPPNSNLKLLAIGGYVDGEGMSKTAELVDPTKLNSCQSVPDYPMTIDGATAQNFGNQFIVSCGAQMCYSYTPSKGWKEYANMAEYRTYAPSVRINDDEMLILGGENDKYQYLKTTEIISAKTRTSRNGTDLPEAMVGQCAVKIDERHVFISNGWTSNTAYIVNVSEEPYEFTRVQSPKERRWGAGCGFIKMKRGGEESGMMSSDDGEPAVIVAGGGIGGTRTTSEIFLIEKNQWVEGPALPRGLYYGGSVNPDEHTFIVAGGWDDERGKPQSDIFQLDVETMQFVTLPGKLKHPRSYLAMTWMPKNDDQC